MADTFRETRLEDLAPIRWMGELAEKMAAVYGAAQDAALAELKTAVKMRLPALAPDDALGWISLITKIPTFAGEPASSLRARLVAAFPTWEEAGLPQGIIRSLNAYGIVDVSITHWSDVLTPDNWFSKFWVNLVADAFPIREQVWGFFDWGDEKTWGTNATLAQIKAIRGQVLYWKSPQSLPVSIRVSTSVGDVEWPMANLWGEAWVVWGGFNWGNGKWANGEW